MKRQLIVVSSNTVNFYLIRENDENVELHIEKKTEIRRAGTIYKGKVKRIVPAMSAVFVDIGEEKEAFLPIKDLQKEHFHIGQPVIVQVKRTAVGKKGAKLSKNIAIAGKYLVLTPLNNNISISNKYKDFHLKQQIKQNIKEILKPYNEENFGFIIRTLACEASDEQIIQDFLTLKQIWEDINKAFKNQKSPSILFEEKYKLFSILKDYAGNFDEIIIEDITLYKTIKNYIQNFFPDKQINLKFFNNQNIPLYEYYQLDKTISKILNPYVWLKSGGYLVIEETEALVVIDVNSGTHCKQKNIEETAFHINKEASIEIAKQVRLRDLGGIIIIDFIDFTDEEKKQELIDILRKEFEKDRRPVKIKSITSLGLLELTRKKLEESLIKQLSQDCIYCRSRGYNKGISLILFEIEKQIQKSQPFAKLEIKVNPLLEEYLKRLLKKLKLTKNVKILTDKNLYVENFIIERGQ